MAMNNEAFEKWYGKNYSMYALKSWNGNYYENIDTELAWAAWQTAKADSAQEIANLMANIGAQEKLGYELQAEIAELNAEVKRWQENSVDLEYKHLQKNAHIYELREALEYMVIGSCTCLTKTPDESVHTDKCRYRLIKNILAKTPAQSLTKIQNETIERCAKVCDEDAKNSREFAEPFAASVSESNAEAIRALKKEVE